MVIESGNGPQIGAPPDASLVAAGAHRPGEHGVGALGAHEDVPPWIFAARTDRAGARAEGLEGLTASPVSGLGAIPRNGRPHSDRAGRDTVDERVKAAASTQAPLLDPVTFLAELEQTSPEPDAADVWLAELSSGLRTLL